MNHLIPHGDLSRIESLLLTRRDQLVSATSWAFNMLLLGLVLAGFGYFLYVQYNTTQEAMKHEEKRIPFTPVTWYSATRNVRSEEYGQQQGPGGSSSGSSSGQLQPFEVETRYGLP